MDCATKSPTCAHNVLKRKSVGDHKRRVYEEENNPNVPAKPRRRIRMHDEGGFWNETPYTALAILLPVARKLILLNVERRLRFDVHRHGALASQIMGVDHRRDFGKALWVQAGDPVDLLWCPSCNLAHFLGRTICCRLLRAMESTHEGGEFERKRERYIYIREGH